MQQVDWYYDFISPYAYFANRRLHEISAKAEIIYRPVLFAGLLGHWEHKGPAEIDSKRLFTYRQVQWSSEREGIPFRMPASHPFNPLPYLRLAIAVRNDPEQITQMFEFVWQRGLDLTQPSTFAQLAEELNVTDASERIGAEAVKSELKHNTDQALAAGVFGVPTWVVDGQLFWGTEAIGFLLDYLDNPGVLQTEEMRRIDTLPVGIRRK